MHASRSRGPRRPPPRALSGRERIAGRDRERLRPPWRRRLRLSRTFVLRGTLRRDALREIERRQLQLRRKREDIDPRRRRARSSGVPQDPVRQGAEGPLGASRDNSPRSMPRWQGGVLSASVMPERSSRRHVGQAHSWAAPFRGHWQRCVTLRSPPMWVSTRRRGAPESAKATIAARKRLKCGVRALPSIRSWINTITMFDNRPGGAVRCRAAFRTVSKPDAQRP